MYLNLFIFIMNRTMPLNSQKAKILRLNFCNSLIEAKWLTTLAYIAGVMDCIYSDALVY